MKVARLQNVIISLLVLSLTACASGSAIVTGTKRTYNVSEFVFPFFLEVEARFWG